MTNEQILKKAIEKAVKNGWTKYGQDWHSSAFGILIEQKKHYWLIFSHSFAKAFWGELVSTINNQSRWQYHLQQMVIEPEPLKYIEKFLDENN